MERLLQTLLEHPDIDKASEAEGKIIAYFKRNVEPSALNKYCFENNLILNHLVLKKLSLEEQFLALTQ
jgi:ABC-2 type transport system ATP-binding protein